MKTAKRGLAKGREVSETEGDDKECAEKAVV